MQLLAEFSDWLTPQAQGGIGDYVYFKLISSYFDHKIGQFGLGLMKRTMAWTSQIALVLATLWILLSGYRIATGQSREPMMALVVNATRIAFIVALATTMSFGGANLHSFFTKDLDREIHQLFTDDNGTSADAIDQNLAYMQIAMNAIDVIQIPDGDTQLAKEKERALLFAGIGSAGPPMVAGAMLLLYKFTLAMFIGLGPIFILCLMFDQTKDLFRKWLLYGIGNLFSMAMLSVVVSMTMELMAKIAVVLWVAKAAKIMGSATEGLTTQAMQQGGIGLLMTTVIVTVPPAAAMFFQGTAASFNYNTAFGPPPKDKNNQQSPAAAPQVTTSAPPSPVQHPYQMPSGASDHGNRTKSYDEVQRR